MTPETLSLLGNTISFFALLGTTLYDLWINPTLFRRDLNAGTEHLSAARSKRNRQDTATKVAFVALSIAFAAFLWGDIMNTSEQPGESIQIEFQALIKQTEMRLGDELLELRRRVERLEGGSGNQDVVPTSGGPGGGPDTTPRLEAIEERLEALAEDLHGGRAELERQIRELTEIVAEVNNAVKELSAQQAELAKSQMVARAAR